MPLLIKSRIESSSALAATPAAVISVMVLFHIVSEEAEVTEAARELEVEPLANGTGTGTGSDLTIGGVRGDK
jgi:hypothetical protein